MLTGKIKKREGAPFILGANQEFAHALSLNRRVWAHLHSNCL